MSEEGHRLPVVKKLTVTPGDRNLPGEKLPGIKATNSSTLKGVAATSKRAEVARQKAEILHLIEVGHTVEDACRLVGKSKPIWEYYRRTDPDFKQAGDLIRARQAGANKVRDNSNISFEEFSDVYLNHRLFTHQLQWIDAIEGRTPRDLHPAQTFIKGDPDVVIVNVPPGHAKSTTITMNYVTYKIVTNPEFRVVIISKTEMMAKKFLQGIKRRLTTNAFSKLQIDFAPSEGFEKSAEVWSSTMIYFGHSESDQKDPNIQVLGIGQQIYGARADLIILDDVEDLNNAHQYAAHLDYIMQDVMTRDAPILVVGTRVAPVDIYSELLNADNYDGEESDWTYLSQPAILEPADDPKDWVTLWPKSDRPHAIHPGVQDENGLWPKWDGERLAKLRRKLKPSTWALVYQQEPISEDSTFTMEAITGVYTNRSIGASVPLDHKYTVAGLDPATQAGFTACVVLDVDRRKGTRHLVDVFNKQVRPVGLRELIMDWTEKYNVNEWRIERNAFQAFLTQDPEINQFLAARGVRLREHSTYSNKHDPEWGVSSLESLFRGWQDGTALLTLPGLGSKEAFRIFKEQLIAWYPNHPKTQKTDLVMAFWFAELAARDITRGLGQKKMTHLENSFLSERDMEQRTVININDWIDQQRNGEVRFA